MTPTSGNTDTMDESKVIIQGLNKAWYAPHVAALDILRLDRLDPVISGNKWYKLKYNLQYALQHNYKSILTFGGAYSNHLIATAAAAQQYGIPSIAIVRGDDGRKPTSTLQACIALGMQLHYVSREEYAKKNDAAWLQQLSDKYGQPFIIPEGGANEHGREGAKDIAALIPGTYTHIAVSVGSGTTLAGLRNALPAGQHILGFVPMKNGAYLHDEIGSDISPGNNNNWQLFDRWHFGGFGKWNDELLLFMNEFYQVNDVPLDIVYTSKMMFGVHTLLKENFFNPAAKVLCIHSGGLQGNDSVSQRLAYNAGI